MNKIKKPKEEEPDFVSMANLKKSEKK